MWWTARLQAHLNYIMNCCWMLTCHGLTGALLCECLWAFSTVLKQWVFSKNLGYWTVAFKCHPLFQWEFCLTILGKQKLCKVFGWFRGFRGQWLFCEVWSSRVGSDYWLDTVLDPFSPASTGLCQCLAGWGCDWRVVQAVCLRHGPDWVIVQLHSSHTRREPEQSCWWWVFRSRPVNVTRTSASENSSWRSVEDNVIAINNSVSKQKGISDVKRCFFVWLAR